VRRLWLGAAGAWEKYAPAALIVRFCAPLNFTVRTHYAVAPSPHSLRR
jgi:hypothetical protein